MSLADAFRQDGAAIMAGAARNAESLTRSWGKRIYSTVNIAERQIVDSILAIFAFTPATVCTGYVAAWATNLHNFRQRSMVERIFWSLPLSLAVSTISCVLIGWFFSLTAVAVLLVLCALACGAIIGGEWLLLRKSDRKWNIGWHPHGNKALLWAGIWAVAAVLLLVDLQQDSQLYMSLAMFDHAMRVNWTESVLRTGVPPLNWLYRNQHPVPMRYYYFWYVFCAAIARAARLPARAVFNASCVWSGFILASLSGLYLKHFLTVGARLRAQFLRAAALLTVTGLGACVNLWNFFYFHVPLPGSLEVWRVGQISSWLDSLLWDPHHVASAVCCMFGFLLAGLAANERTGTKWTSVVFISFAFASAFGLSIYVAFAFFLVAAAWAIWSIAAERSVQSPLLLAAGGIGAAILLVPYLHQLETGNSNVQGAGSVFRFAVREMIPPERLLASSLFQRISAAHPFAASNLANLVLLVPGYAVELGFFFAVLLIFLIPRWRGGTPVSSAQRTLVFISVATLAIVTFIRSSVIEYNDFGWRGALLLQFPLLLLGSEVLSSWDFVDHKQSAGASQDFLPGRTPYLVRSIASFALIFGVFTSLYQAAMIRATLFLYEKHLNLVHDPRAGRLAHKAFISQIGYSQLDMAIPHGATVQYNPQTPDIFWLDPDWVAIGRQSAIDVDQPSCGAEFGGDPSGCLPMAAAIDALYKDATAEQARATCRQIGIQYLIAKVYDPPWNDKQSWVWTLPAVVADPEFRALNCAAPALQRQPGGRP